ncbi:MAG: class I tRNA ligase family protein [Candidatus Pacebacteria bacterium]|nr:class I tRNA ligase family protein [Candidatus Paceibacterota bacterium]
MENNKKLITTAIAYSNGEPHIGNAFEFIITDVYNRYLLSLQEKDTFFTTGMDEHGSKIFKAAQDNNISPQVFTDRISEIFMDLDKRLNINYNQFTRTTNSKHITLAKNI